MTECNKSIYLANKSIDTIDAVNKGYEYGYNKAIDDFVGKVELKYLGVHPDELYEKYYPSDICKQIKEMAEQLKEMQRMNTEIEKFADYLIEWIVSKNDMEFDRLTEFNIVRMIIDCVELYDKERD